MKVIIPVLFILSIISQIACNQSNSKNIEFRKYKSKKLSSNCDSLLSDLIHSSSYSTPFGDYTFKINEINDTIIHIKIIAKNDDNSNAIGWMSLNIYNEYLIDTTYDIEEPDTISFNKSIFNILKSQLCFDNVGPSY